MFRSLLLFFTAASLQLPAQAANYEPNSWFLMGGLAYDVVNPAAINDKTNNSAPIQGLVSGRFQVERGLVGPNWSHWAEFGYHRGSVTGADDQAKGSIAYEQKFSYISLIPLGATYWFKRAAYMDFGVSMGLGLGFASSLSVSATPSGKTTLDAAYETQGSGSLSPVLDSRVSARMWLGKYVGFTVTGLLSYYGSRFEMSYGSVRGNFFGASMIVGLNVAFGGAKGLGRTYVEVLPAKREPPARPQQRPAPTAPSGSRR